MNHSDPLDELLRDAFDADAARHRAPDVTTPVMRRIHWRLRLRAAILGGAALAGVAGALVFGTDLGALTTPLWGSDLTLVQHVDRAVLIGAALTVLCSLFVVAEESV